MKKTILKIAGVIMFAILALSTFAQNFDSGQEMKEAQLLGPDKKLEGVWRTRLAVRDCQTGAELVTFPGLLTYHKDGTVSETTGTYFRSSGHGTWEQITSKTYRARFMFFIFNPDGSLAGHQKITQDLIRISPSGNEFIDQARIEIFDVDGNLIATPCGGATAARFE